MPLAPALVTARRLGGAPEPERPAQTAPPAAATPFVQQPEGGEDLSLEPGFSIDRVFIRFASEGRPVENFSVKNNRQVPLFLTADAFKVEHPGLPEEKRVATREIVVAPRRVTLMPGERRTLRLLLRGEPEDVEGVYRVQIVPQLETFEKQRVELRAGGEVHSVMAVVGLGLLVVAEPAEVHSALEWQRSLNALTLENRGNVNVLLDRMQLCRGEGECQALPMVRLYAGNRLTLPAPAASSLQFLKRIGSEYERVVIPPGGAAARPKKR